MDDKRFVRPLTAGAAAFVVLLLLPVVSFALYYRVFPNVFEAPVYQLWQLSGSLFSSNTGAALRLIFFQPLAIVGYVEAGTGLRVWEAYAYPIPTLALLAGALYGGFVVSRGKLARSAAVQLAVGFGFMALALSHVRVAACCTGPGWVVDVWLRGFALSPSPGGGIDWPILYQRVETLLLPSQAALAAAGVALLAYVSRSGVKRN